jgi:hypothetical protein
MLAPSVIQSVQNAGATTLPTTSETVAATSPQVTTDNATRTVSIEANLNITTGAGVTALVLRVRKGSLTGALMGNAQTVTVSAAASYNLSICADDVPGDESEQTYVVTVQQTGASGNGSVNQANLYAMVH